MSGSEGKSFESMAFLRLGPDTGIAARRDHHGVWHTSGCTCPGCVRAFAPRSRTAADQLIINQAYREAAGRAEVARELADNGAYPYRSALADGAIDEKDRSDAVNVPAIDTSDCTCRPPAWKPGSPYWGAHDIRCPMRARLCEQAGRKAHEAMLAERKAAQAAKTAGPAPALTPEQEIRRELAAYDTWMVSGPEIPSWMEPGSLAAGPGRCRECHLGYAAQDGGLCTYCQLRTMVTRANRERRELAAPDRDRGLEFSRWLMIALSGVMAWILLYLVLTGALG